ncbi:MAG: HlyD family efflux transporter periplasmic adaptor subunit, partial [Candidatus Omnitrophica bacterium]|nr:HlyD family efflux transporter periplasmic adaptor subunit [Candidatus Omnitrophota bacterium]
PLLAPIDGEVIVATTQAGQTVTTSDSVVVLSDRLIVRAQVDETDIGKVKQGQKAVISLDAYPDTKINASVDHIYYESETVNNVTIYKVDLVSESAPKFFRSGMNATVDFTVLSIENALLIPVVAVHKDKNENYVLLKQAGSINPVKRVVELGITDDKNYEVISGVTANDTIIITTKKYVFPSNGNTGSNPFLPKMPSSRKGQSGPP